MSRRDQPAFKRLEAISFETPSKRELSISTNDYQPFGALYSYYRYLRKTWIREGFRWPWGNFDRPRRSEFIEEAEHFAESIRSVDHPAELSCVVEAMARLAPALLDDRNRWQRFRDEMEIIREAMETDDSMNRFPDGEPGQSRTLAKIAELRKEVPAYTTLQTGLRSVLFAFARSVAGRRNWKRPLNKWENAVAAAQTNEFCDSRRIWSKRDCLVHARYQLVILGRRPKKGDVSLSFNRTVIRDRASIIWAISQLTDENDSFRSIIEQVRKSRSEGNWESYLNKLPKHLFPKKDCA